MATPKTTTAKKPTGRPDSPTGLQRIFKNSEGLSAGEWARANLFNRWYNTVFTIIFSCVIVVLLFFAIRFLLVTGNWAPVRENLTQFMIGSFPRSEQWRIIAQIVLISVSIGLLWGAFSSKNQYRNSGTVSPEAAVKPKPFWRRYIAIWILLAILLILTQSILPLVFIVSLAASLVISTRVGKLMPLKYNSHTQFFAMLCFIWSYQILSGTQGSAWVWTALLAVIAAIKFSGKNDMVLWMRLVIAGFAAGAVYGIYQIPMVSFSGVSWEKWAGFHLNLTVTLVALVLAFPLGILLALGRRSNLPAIRYISVGYIELIRGVPLIGLLFVGDIFLGFFINRVDSLSSVTRAIVVLALFTAAYLAEIFRGGLRAVPLGQIDAANAVGLGRFQSFSWVIFPQAFRTTIPALVGQSIRLFKDTSLLTIISIAEILSVRERVHTQEAFVGIGIAETLIFVSFAFWAISYTMSRESQLLETKLGVRA